MRLLFCVILFVESLLAHPQCLDGKPPFLSSPELKFCKEYKDVGCCSATDDVEIKQRYKSIKSRLPKSCRPYMKALLCQRCSPYAAHLYNFEENGVSEPSPGLCSKYCADVYNACGRKGLKQLSKDTNYRKAIKRKSKFCDYSRLEDEIYCYPDLKADPDLNDRFTKQNNDSKGCMCLQKIAERHGLITIIESNPTSDSFLYIGEQRGVVYVYEDGVKQSTPFLDITDRVLITKRTGDERGLLGMVFHPDFGTNRQFFVYYVADPNQGKATVLSQFRANDDLTAVKNSEYILLTISQPYGNHNGGPLLFGDDGYLYLFTGDGGSGGDPADNGQSLETLLGKALRILIDNDGRGYTIPPDNPFLGIPNAREEIYAYGLRNPWRCSKDMGDPDTGAGKGRIFCGDVGQTKFEEVDIIVEGGNFGWAAREGFECFKADLCNNIGPEVLPIHVYGRSVGRSVTGGFVYRGCEYPPFNGDYIFADFATGKLFRLHEDENNLWTRSEIKLCSGETCSGNWVPTYGRGISTFGTNNRGDIFMASTSDFSAFGTESSAYKMIMQPFRRQDPTLCEPDPEG